MLDENIWNNQEKYTKLLIEQKNIQKKLDEYDKLNSIVSEVQFLIEMHSLEENEKELESIEEQLQKNMDLLSSKIEKLKLSNLLNKEYDRNDAILSIHAGSGGIDAMDLAKILYRMYVRWADKNEFNIDILSYETDDVAGLKSATLKISGEFAYGYLKSETGVHRFVRISPFDSASRRHTSFVAVEVIPDIEDVLNVEINPNDIRIDTFRASGAGGQHVNKTDSAVRITHKPTSIVVTCQNERSQIQNKETAMKILISKLITLQQKEKKDKISDIKGDFSQITWGSQIRSYVFQPYQSVKDHRTNVETSKIQDVLDGDLEIFINSYLKYINNKE